MPEYTFRTLFCSRVELARMQVAVIGAGIAGLSAARELAALGAGVVILEVQHRIGGRALTYSRDGFTADMGIQTYTPRGMRFEDAIRLAGDEALPIAGEIFLHAEGRPLPGSPERNREVRYTFQLGNHRLAEILSQGVDVRLETRVERICKIKGNFRVADVEADAVILTPPIPETERLLRTAGDKRNLARAAYRPCISIALAYRAVLKPRPYYALLAEDRMEPVLWLSIENLKCPGRAPDGWTLVVVQTGPAYSRAHLATPEEELVRTVSRAVRRLFAGELGEPEWYHVVRWQQSQPERVVLFESANQQGGRLIVAGDGTLAGRAENAYETGLLAARLAVERVRGTV